MINFEKKQALIVGGSGLIGGNCFKYFTDHTNWEITATHRSYPTQHTVLFDPLKIEDFPWVFKKKWDVILYTGALTQADQCEIQKELSFLLSVKSTAILVSLAKSVNAKFIYTSSDYIFDGKCGPYMEEARTNPLSVYGQHKTEAEEVICSTLKNFLIIRITNVYGSEERGKNFVARLLKTLEKTNELELTVPMDQFATPINALDIARALFELIEHDKRGVYHLGSTDYMSRAQIVDRIRNYFPQKTFKINKVKTGVMGQLATRPLMGGLLSKKFLTEFPAFEFNNLDDYLKGLYGRF